MCGTRCKGLQSYNAEFGHLSCSELVLEMPEEQHCVNLAHALKPWLMLLIQRLNGSKPGKLHPRHARHMIHRWQQAGLLLDGASATVSTFNSAIIGCKNSGHWRLAVLLIGEMQHRQLQLQILTYNAALGACTCAAVRQRHTSSRRLRRCGHAYTPQFRLHRFPFPARGPQDC